MRGLRRITLLPTSNRSMLLRSDIDQPTASSVVSYSLHAVQVIFNFFLNATIKWGLAPAAMYVRVSAGKK